MGESVAAEDLVQQARTTLCALVPGYDPRAGEALPYFSLRLRLAMRRHLARVARERPAGRHVPDHFWEAQDSTDALAAQIDAERFGWARSGTEAALLPGARSIADAGATPALLALLA